MSLTPQTITIDLNPSFSQMQTVHCSQYDDNIRQIEVKLKDGGTDIDVSSYTIYIEGTKPDKKGFSYPLTNIGSVSGNTVTFYVQLQMAAVPGMTRMEILLKDGDDHRIGSANFMLAVERAGLQDDTDVSDSELAPYISGAAAQAQAAANSAAAAEQAKDDAIQAKDDAIQAKESAEQSAESISGLTEQIEQNTEDTRDLKNAFDYLELYAGGTKDFEIAYTRTDGQKYDTDGSLATDENSFITNKIAIDGSMLTITITKLRATEYCSYATFWDALGHIVQTNVFSALGIYTKKLTIPNGAAFVAFSGTKAANTDFTVTYEGFNTTKNVTGTILTGSSIDSRNGNVRTDFADAICTDYIDVSDANSKYLYSGWVYYFLGIAGYDANGTYITPILVASAGENKEFKNFELTIPSTVKKIRATSYHAVTGASNFISVIKVASNSAPRMNHVYVATTGNDSTGDGTAENPYATIYHANDVITDSSYYNRYTIHVADGTYTDLQTRYAGQASGQYEGIICKDYVYYEGNTINPQKVIISWDGSTGFDASTMRLADAIDKAPFHIVPTSVGNYKNGLHTSIKGFKFNVKNCRYAIHVEASGKGKELEWEIASCDLTGYEGRPVLVTNGNNGNTSMPAIGMGSCCFEKGTLRDCKFPPKPVSGDVCYGFNFGIINHDNVLNTNDYAYGATFAYLGAEYHIENCNLNGNDILFRSLYDIAYDTNNLAMLINCNNINALQHAEESGVTNHWTAVVLGCNIGTNQFA